MVRVKCPYCRTSPLPNSPLHIRIADLADLRGRVDGTLFVNLILIAYVRDEIDYLTRLLLYDGEACRT